MQTVIRLVLAGSLGLAAGSASGSPIHVYTFEEAYVGADGRVRTPDAIGGADGIILNGATVADGRLSLDGIDDHVVLPSIITGQRFAVEIWLRIPPGATQIQTLLATTGATADRDGWKLFANKFNGSQGPEPSASRAEMADHSAADRCSAPTAPSASATPSSTASSFTLTETPRPRSACSTMATSWPVALSLTSPEAPWTSVWEG